MFVLGSNVIKFLIIMKFIWEQYIFCELVKIEEETKSFKMLASLYKQIRAVMFSSHQKETIDN